MFQNGNIQKNCQILLLDNKGTLLPGVVCKLIFCIVLGVFLVAADMRLMYINVVSNLPQQQLFHLNNLKGVFQLVDV